MVSAFLQPSVMCQHPAVPPPPLRLIRRIRGVQHQYHLNRCIWNTRMVGVTLPADAVFIIDQSKMDSYTTTTDNGNNIPTSIPFQLPEYEPAVQPDNAHQYRYFAVKSSSSADATPC